MLLPLISLGLIIGMLSACGSKRKSTQESRPPAASCSVFSEEDGVHIKCSDGTEQVVPGPVPGLPGPVGPAGPQGDAGAAGKDGSNGADGYSLVSLSVAAPSSVCSNGGSILLVAQDLNRNGLLDLDFSIDGEIRSLIVCNGMPGRDGVNGRDGIDGRDGAPGPAGSPGPQGPAGSPGVSAASYSVAILDPCGNKAGILDEVIVKLPVGNGQFVLLSSVSDKANGENTRLSVLEDGSYITSDGSKCKFEVQGSEILNARY